MRRLTLVLLAFWVSFGGMSGTAFAQTTDLDAGYYIDQLTSFSLTWDPDKFDGELSGIGGVRLTGEKTRGDVFASTAASGAECVSQRSLSERLSVVDREEPLCSPDWPDGN